MKKNWSSKTADLAVIGSLRRLKPNDRREDVAKEEKVSDMITASPNVTI